MESNSMKKLVEQFELIIGHQYRNREYGLRESEYTNEIIEAESKVLARHRTFDHSKIYAFNAGAAKPTMKSFSDMDKVIDYVKESFGSPYIICQDTAYAVSVDCDGKVVNLTDISTNEVVKYICE